MIGADDQDNHAEENERPAHPVTIAKPFYLAARPVALGEYRRLCEYQHREHSAFLDEHAVNFISSNDADAFVLKLNALRPAAESKVRYRLPTENEWEYACRAGTSTRFYYGDDRGYLSLGDYAWYAANAWDVGSTNPQPVGCKKPNPFGLWDMHGNVWEWTSDGWASYREILRDGEGVRNRTMRVLRGGSFCHEARYIRASDRDQYDPSYSHYYTGFRLCMDILA